jgi:hypothetical protein
VTRATELAHLERCAPCATAAVALDDAGQSRSVGVMVEFCIRPLGRKAFYGRRLRMNVKPPAGRLRDLPRLEPIRAGDGSA